MQYPGATTRLREAANLGGCAAARKEPSRGYRRAFQFNPHDAIGRRGRDRAVGLEIGVQRVDVVDADLRRGSFLQAR